MVYTPALLDEGIYIANLTIPEGLFWSDIINPPGRHASHAHTGSRKGLPRAGRHAAVEALQSWPAERAKSTALACFLAGTIKQVIPSSDALVILLQAFCDAHHFKATVLDSMTGAVQSHACYCYLPSSWRTLTPVISVCRPGGRQL